MASDLDYVSYVVEQIKTVHTIRYLKMFGEYMIYANDKPVLLICDNTTFVKKLDCVKDLLDAVVTGIPYHNAKEHYIVDTEDSELLSNIVNILEQNVPLPKKKKKVK